MLIRSALPPHLFIYLDHWSYKSYRHQILFTTFSGLDESHDVFKLELLSSPSFQLLNDLNTFQSATDSAQHKCRTKLHASQLERRDWLRSSAAGRAIESVPSACIVRHWRIARLVADPGRAGGHLLLLVVEQHRLQAGAAQPKRIAQCTRNWCPPCTWPRDEDAHWAGQDNHGAAFAKRASQVSSLFISQWGQS